MAQDLRILLSAQLDVKQSVTDINLQIDQIQSKLKSLKVNIDLSSLNGTINQFANNVASSVGQTAGQVVKNSVKNSSAEMQKMMKELQTEARRMQKELGFDSSGLGTNAMKTVFTRDAKQQVTGATVTYSDKLGQSINANFDWVEKTVNGKLQKVFQYTGQKDIIDSGKVETSLDKLIAKAEKLKYELESGKTKIFDDGNLNNLVNEYDKVIAKVNQLKSSGDMQSQAQIEGIDKEIEATKKLTYEIQTQQKEHVRLSNLGRTQIGTLNGLDLGSADIDKIRQQYANQLTSHLQANGKPNAQIKLEDVSLSSLRTDPNTGEWVAKLNATLADGKNKVLEYKGSMDALTGTTRIYGAEVQTTASRNLSFFDKLKVAMQNIPIWMVGMTAFMQTLHFFEDGVKYVNDLNKALTLISTTTNKSQAQVQALGQEFQQMAMKMGVTTKEIADGSVEFFRQQGLSDAEVKNRLTTATEYAKISGLEFKKSAELLTAASSSMNLPIQKVADVFTLLGDSVATSANEVGTAYQKIGGEARAVGISFEQSAAMIAVLSSKTRESAETIGDSLKSVFARVQQLKEKGFAEEDGTKVNQVAKSLATVGVELVDANGQFRNLGTVLDELGKKWNDLDQRHKMYIATTVAGNYQSARFNNTMNNWSEIASLTTKAMDAAGTTQSKYNLYLQGTEAHLNTLKTAWTGVFQDSFNSSGINGLVSSLTVLASAFDYLVKTIGIVPVTMGLVTATFMAFSKTTNIFIPLKNMFVSLGTSLEALEVKMVAAETGAKAFGVAMRGLLSAAMPLVGILAVVGASWGFEKLVSSMEEAKQKQEEFKKQQDTIVVSITQHKEAVDKLVDKYKSLSKETSNGTVFNDNQKEQDYYSTMTDLAKLMPNLVDSIDAKGNAHLKNVDAIEKELQYSKDLAEHQRKVDIQNADKAIQSANDDYNKANKGSFWGNLFGSGNSVQKAKAQKAMVENNAGLVNFETGQDTNAELAQKNLDLFNAEHEAADKAKQRIQEVQNLISNLAKDSDLKFGDEINKQFKQISEGIDFSKVDPKVISTSIKAIFDDLKKLQTDGYQAAEKDTNDLGIALKNLGSSFTAQDLIDAMKSSSNSINNAKENVVTYDEALKQLQANYKSSSSELSILNKLIEDNANGKKVSADEVMKLVEKDASMVNMFQLENGQIKLNTKAIEDKKNAMIDSFAKEAQQQQINILNSNTVLQQKLKMFGVEIKGLEDIANAQEKINGSYDEQLKKAMDAGNYHAIDLLSHNKLDASQWLDDLTKLQEQAKIAATALNTVGESTSSHSAKQPVKQYDASNFKANKIDIQEIDAAIKGLEQTTNSYDKTSQDYRDGLAQEIVLQKQKKAAAHENADDLRTQLAKLEGELSNLGNFDSLGDAGKQKWNDLTKNIDQTKRSLDDMSNAWWDAFGKINSINYETVTSQLDQFDLKIKDVDQTLAQLKSEQGVYKEGNVQWVKSIEDQNEAIRQKQVLLHQEHELIAQQIKDGDLTSEQVRTLTEKMRGLSVTYNDLTTSMTQNEQQLVQKRDDAANQLIQEYKNAYARQKQLMDDSYDEQIKKMGEAHQQEIFNIDESQKAYERKLQLIEKTLDRANSENRFQTELAKKERERQELSNKVDALAMDNSAEGKSQLKALKYQLTDMNSEITQMQLDHSAELQKNALHDAETQSQLDVQKQKDTLDVKYKQDKDALELERKQNDQALENMSNDEQRWTKIRIAVEQGHVKDVIEGLGQIDNVWQTFVNTKAPLLASDLKKNLFDQVTKAITDQQDQVQLLTDKLGNLASAGDVVSKMQDNSQNWFSATPDGKKKIEESQQNLANQIGATKNSNGDWTDKSGNLLYNNDGLYHSTDQKEQSAISRMKSNSSLWFQGGTGDANTAGSQAWYAAQNEQIANDIHATKGSDGNWYKNNLRLYHSGGIVGGSGNKMTNLINQMFNASPNEQVIMALENELMSPSDNITKNFLPNLGGLVSSVSSKVASSVVGGSVININIGSVTGDKTGADLVSTTIVKELKKLGKQF